MAGNRRQAGGLLYAAGISGCVVQEDGSQKEGGCDLEIALVLKSVQSAESPGKAVREKLRKKSVKSPGKVGKSQKKPGFSRLTKIISML